jgi:hypothetical protein
MAPMSLPPTSPLITQLVMGSPDRVSPMQWYLDILYINHGYHFFAPDPGPGHLINYVVTDERGATIADGTFPDVNEYWPRLRYHRHFMLTDQAELPMRNHDPQTAQQMTLDAYARHLLREYDGSQAEVTRVRHYMLSPREKNDNIAIDDPRKYETVMQRIQRASDLNQPPATTAAAPNPEFGAWRDTGQMRRMR